MYEKYVEPEARKGLLAKLDETVEWLYTEEGKNTNRDVYK
jgi:hypothetical protein